MNTNANSNDAQAASSELEHCQSTSAINSAPTAAVDTAELAALLDRIHHLAQTCDRDCIQLLVILRGLEAVHRDIRETLFQPALPDNRQALYALLRDIESEGGWPYINRMKIREFLHHLDEANVEPPDAAAP